MLSFFSRKTTEKNFLSLVVSEGTVSAALWSVGGVGPKVIKYSSAVAWNSEAESSLVEASDVALEELGTQANSVKEVLLGLPEDWAQNQSIASDKKHTLKKLTDQLNLKSVGFVITQEAIAALYRDREHTGCNALLVYVSQKTVYLLNILHGKASDPTKVGRSESLVKDVIEGCARGSWQALPARILLASQDFSEAEMMAAQQDLQNTSWEEKLFVHPPRVDIVPPHSILDAVSLSGGREVARALGILKEENGETPPKQKEEKTQPAFGFKPVEHKGQENDGDDDDEEQEDDEDANENEEGDEEAAGDKVLDVGIQKPPRSRLPGKKLLVFFFLVLLLAFGSVFGVYSVIAYTYRAKLAVTIKTEPVSFDSTMTVDANASQTDPTNNILKATLRTKDVSDTSEAMTTGTKIIGDKATGSIVIYNRTTVGDKTFKAGTIVKLDDKVQFSLDSDITVPMGTKDSSPPYQGTAVAKVTATNIGAESNIDKATELSIGGFDKASFVALTNDKFAGGSSRNIQVVSDADQKKLGDTLYAQLKQKALAAFNQESNPNEHVILSDKVSVTKKQYSDDIGKEVKSFTLTMTVTATAIVYTNDDIAAFATQKLASQIPAGAVLKSDQTVVEVNGQQAVSDSKTIVKAKISSFIIPGFDSGQIAKVLAGKSREEAINFLQSQHAIASYTLDFQPAFAAKLMGRLPSGEKISITTTVQ